jgi:hypothetical protein
MLSTYGLRTAFFASIATLLASFPAAANVVITIDKSTQRMAIAVDGLNRWKDYFSKEWDDAPMPNSIFFTQRGHAIHGSAPACLCLDRLAATMRHPLLCVRKVGNLLAVQVSLAPR